MYHFLLSYEISLYFPITNNNWVWMKAISNASNACGHYIKKLKAIVDVDLHYFGVEVHNFTYFGVEWLDMTVLSQSNLT